MNEGEKRLDNLFKASIFPFCCVLKNLAPCARMTLKKEKR